MSPFSRRLQQAGSGWLLSSYSEFAAGSVMPIGSKDSGVRNVGVRIPKSQLTVYQGSITMTASTNLVGLDIYGQVKGRGGTVTDCIIRGLDKPATQNAFAVGQSYDFGGTVFAWCTFDGTGRESMFADCINGGNYTAKYCEFTRGVDGIGADAVGNATIECCRIYDGHYASWWDDSTSSPRTVSYTDTHGVTYNPPFPAQGTGDTHSDGAQIQGYTGWVLRGNYIGGQRITAIHNGQLDPTISSDQVTIDDLDAGMDFVNSGIIVNAITDNHVGALIELNWIAGGATRLNLSTAGTDLLAGVTVQNNRFIRSTYGGGGGYYIYAADNYQAVLSNNVYDDTNAAVPINTYLHK